MSTSQNHTSTGNIRRGHPFYKSRVAGPVAGDLQHINTQAEDGNPEAQHELGCIYEQGEGVERDLGAAVGWYRKAAKGGCAKAQVSLGWMYRHGHGIERDLLQSAHWYCRGSQHYRRKADHGDAMAQLALGWMYESGEAVKRDYLQAVKWYRKAADQDLQRAQFDLAGMCYGGYGVKQDFAEAYKWFYLSGPSGWDLYAAHMTAEQIAEGKSRAHAFHQRLTDLREIKAKSIERLPLCERRDVAPSPAHEVQLFRLAQARFNQKRRRTLVIIAFVGVLLSALFVVWNDQASPDKTSWTPPARAAVASSR